MSEFCSTSSRTRRHSSRRPVVVDDDPTAATAAELFLREALLPVPVGPASLEPAAAARSSRSRKPSPMSVLSMIKTIAWQDE